MLASTTEPSGTSMTSISNAGNGNEYMHEYRILTKQSPRIHTTVYQYRIWYAICILEITSLVFKHVFLRLKKCPEQNIRGHVKHSLTFKPNAGFNSKDVLKSTNHYTAKFKSLKTYFIWLTKSKMILHRYDSQHKLVLTLFMICWKHAGDTKLMAQIKGDFSF